jgi:hypothetical protein
MPPGPHPGPGLAGIRTATATPTLQGVPRLEGSALALGLGLLLCGCAPTRLDAEGWRARFQARQGMEARGLVQVREANGTVHVRGTLERLAPGPYLLMLDPGGNCAEDPTEIRTTGLQYEDGRGIGGAGGPESHHGAPILLFVADRKGRARLDFTTSAQGLAWGGGSVLGKAFEVREAYPGKTAELRPAGASDGAGQAVACGRVEP